MSPYRRPLAAASALALLVALAGCSVHLDSGGGSSAPATAPTSASDGGAAGSPAAGDDTPAADGDASASAFCADATGDLGLQADASNPSAEALSAWDRMAADAPDDIRDEVARIDEVLHEASKGDASGADDAFSASLVTVSTWIATNCDRSAD